MFNKPSGVPHDSTLAEKMSDNPSVRDSGVETLSIHKSRLIPSANQPRKYFAPEAIAEKRQQMESDGQESPITVYPPIAGSDGRDVWPIHDGECRWRAALESSDEKLEYLRAELYQGDTQDTFKKMLSQLMHNDDGSLPLTNVEKAMAYKVMLEEKAKQGSESPVNDVAKALGKPASHVSELLKIAEMPEEMIDFSLERGITDTRVLSGMMRIHKKGGEEVSRQLIEELGQGAENGQPLRDIVKKHTQQVKNKKPVKQAGKKKEKPIRLITATTVKVREKGNGQKVLSIETTREIININITDEHLAELS
jgi:ParB/RepB/Spo0J family partition protein